MPLWPYWIGLMNGHSAVGLLARVCRRLELRSWPEACVFRTGSEPGGPGHLLQVSTVRGLTARVASAGTPLIPTPCGCNVRIRTSNVIIHIDFSARRPARDLDPRSCGVPARILPPPPAQPGRVSYQAT